MKNYKIENYLMAKFPYCCHANWHYFKIQGNLFDCYLMLINIS